MGKRLGYCCLGILLVITKSYSWNALGHRLVAQIAYNHLTKQAKQIFNHYNHTLDKQYRPQSLVNAAVWLDRLHDQNQLWLAPKHYINIPFTKDGTRLIQPARVNAVSAVEEAMRVINSPQKSELVKGFSLRVLLHVVGDLHQPMHAVNQFSVRYPKGDKGGNLYLLGANPIASNLHSYWDKGGGMLSKKRHYSQAQVNRLAYRIEQRWPCSIASVNLQPKVWATESHQLAIHKAYQIKAGQKPDKRYQRMVKATTEERLAIAGCRLAAVLNTLAANYEAKNK
ncbi:MULTISPECIES: S1/P1 nuclease [unclassified Legionella]|uniref:S1/P1 nuclease n=1 Tax=unclassified Legionella TaxID=2622702 RepID=UPI001E34EC32|nr:S1/P1 nuclease [Legionella sp. 31fI33]MCC5015988.1 S1/P1 nuclease [Legionella sp. 31fI33]